MADQYSAYPGTGAYGGYTQSPGPSPAPRTAPASVDPIISRLRPRDMVGILDQAFRLYRAHFLTFLAIIAIVEVPLQMAIQLITVFIIGNPAGLYTSSLRSDFSPSSTNEYLTNTLLFSGATLVLSGLYGILMYIAQSALTSSVADSYLDRKVSFGGAYREVGRRIGPVLGLMVLQFLIQAAAFLPAILLFTVAIVGTLTALGADSSNGGVVALLCLAFPALLVGFGFYIFAYVRLLAAVPALMVEKLGPVQAVRRSWNLIQGYWWRTVGLWIVLAILGMVVSSGPAALIAALVTLVIKTDFATSQMITGIVTVFTSAIFIPIQLIAYTLYYFDIRVRKEGFDLETAMNQAYPGNAGYAGYPGYPGNPGYGQPNDYNQYGAYNAGNGQGQPQPYPQAPMQAPPPTLGYDTQQNGYPARVSDNGAQGQGYGYAPPPIQAPESPLAGADPPAPGEASTTEPGGDNLPAGEHEG